jgi:lysosomal acid lipase/cholesteryl ester hydrolase
MLKELPPHTVATEIPHYEHLDFLWAREVNTLVFPHVFDALESFSDAEHSKEEYDRYRSARHASLGAGIQRPRIMEGYLSDEDGTQTTSGSTYADIAAVIPGKEADALVKRRNGTADGGSSRKRVRMQKNEYDDSSEGGSSPVGVQHVRTEDINGNGNGRESPTSRLKGMRSGSIGSNLSFGVVEGKGTRGITLGAGKAVSAVTTTSSDDGGGGSADGRKKGNR